MRFAFLFLLAATALPAQQSLGPDSAEVFSIGPGGNRGSAVQPVKIRAKGKGFAGQLIAYRMDEKSPVRPPLPAPGTKCTRTVVTSTPLAYKADTLLWAWANLNSTETEVWCVSEAVSVTTLNAEGHAVRLEQRRKGAALGLKVVPPPAIPRGARISQGGMLQVPVTAEARALSVAYGPRAATEPLPVIGANADSTLRMYGPAWMGPDSGKTHPPLVKLSLGNYVHSRQGTLANWYVSTTTNFLSAAAFPANSHRAEPAPRLVFSSAHPSIGRVVGADRWQCLKVGAAKLRVRWVNAAGTTLARDSSLIYCNRA